MFSRSSFGLASFSPASWHRGDPQPPATTAGGLGGFVGGRQNKAWPKRKKRREDLVLELAALGLVGGSARRL